MQLSEGFVMMAIRASSEVYFMLDWERVIMV
jgi:hypothetical protein